MTHIILVPGLWLDGEVWADVESRLRSDEHNVTSLTLPGQGAPSDGSAATLETQLDALLAIVDASSEPVILVGHSAASTLVWLAADRRPGRVRRVLMVGGFPASSGDSYAAFFDIVEGAMPFPGWSSFEGPDSADLSEKAKERFSERAHSVPEGVAKGIVDYGDEGRFEVPVTLVCPEYTPADAKEWLDAGHLPELSRVRTLDYVDIDSGHWPMITQSERLADIIRASAAG